MKQTKSNTNEVKPVFYYSDEYNGNHNSRLKEFNKECKMIDRDMCNEQIYKHGVLKGVRADLTKKQANEFCKVSFILD